MRRIAYTVLITWAVSALPSDATARAGGDSGRLGSPGGVSVKIFDLAGRHVRSLLTRESLSEGEHVLRWDGRGSDGGSVSNGV